MSHEWRRTEIEPGHAMSDQELTDLWRRTSKPSLPLWKFLAWAIGMGGLVGLLVTGKLNEWLYRITR